MTEEALRRGFGMLLTMWPHRATDQATVSNLSALYYQALHELSDEAWGLACLAAIKTCKHFPVPAELQELAEVEAEHAQLDRVQATEQRRLRAATMRLLPSPTLTAEHVAERETKARERANAIRQSIQEGAERLRQQAAKDYWAKPRRQRRRRPPLAPDMSDERSEA